MLERDGWTVRRVSGDHHIFTLPERPAARVILQHPRKDIPTGTLRNIFRQAGWTWPPR